MNKLYLLPLSAFCVLLSIRLFEVFTTESFECMNTHLNHLTWTLFFGILSFMASECIQFLVQGSAAEPYEVTFVRTGTEFSARCTCLFGQNGLLCKHRVNILEGHLKNIVSDNVSDVDKVQSWLPGSSIQHELRNLKICEARVKAANHELSEVQHRLAEVMNASITYDHDSDVRIIR